MSFDARRLLELLPAIYTIRDLENGGPLADLLSLLAEQISVLEDDLDQLYDDHFVETCAEWVLPYIGDAIGYRTLHSTTGNAGRARAEVAHTIGFRRRKGTLSALEALARDVTGWRASAAEYFQRLITTQHVNHVRTHVSAAPDVRDGDALERIGTAFDRTPRAVDVRRIESRRGRHNIPNIGIFLWRLRACPLTLSPAAKVDTRRYRFHPLGIDQPLFTLPENVANETDLVGARNVPVPISRRALERRTGELYPDATDTRTKSLRLHVDTDGAGLKPVPLAKICSCHLGDVGGSWVNLPPAGMYAIDPVLGRLALPPEATDAWRVSVECHHGFPADLGGGEYDRTLPAAEGTVVRVPDDQPTLQAALTQIGGAGTVEITTSGTFTLPTTIDVNAGARLRIRAANRTRPTLMAGANVALRGGPDSELLLSGLTICGGGLNIPAASRLARLTLEHCTLVPGLRLAPDREPLSPSAASIVIEPNDVTLVLQRCITGPLRAPEGASISAVDCIVDAMQPEALAYAASDGSPGGALTLEQCTVIGRITATTLPLVSNCILFAKALAADEAPVRAELRQHGCVRFTWLPPTSRTPRRHRCLPESVADPRDTEVRFTSTRYGHPAYMQLSIASGAQLLSGADNEAEPGVYHHLFGTHREQNMRIRLGEYLRVGLEAGIFYEN